ncbi:MAG: transcription antitermination factor NusB [Peptoniphilaceae bacterium]|nr:transcription antitermination factor NusB [Peptoniphilaceae bacterium]MDY6019394.1 transcription antitermination factor NusB [Anaerococcus sp.]
MTRVEEREWVFKIIFGNLFDSQMDLQEIFDNYGLDFNKDGFIYKSLSSYLNEKEIINQILIEELGKNSFNRLNKIDKSILSLSINEIKFLAIPASVSINEAVNISKKYAAQDSYKYINSVLGSIVRKGM